ncbi:MAG: two-component regulator propeller domain-containing protein, partial [Ignavibacteriaceae bacterium]
MKVFLPEENDSSSISSREIVTIYEDKNKTLWVGTWNGLNKFNRINETFTRYKRDTNNTHSINADWIKCIYEDRFGRFWVGTNNGLNKFDREKQAFEHFWFYHPESKYGLIVNALFEDPESNDLLVGTHLSGLWKFNTKEKILSEYNFNSEDANRKKIGVIQSFCKSRDGKIWMASDHSLSSLDPQTKKYKCYFEVPGMPSNWNGGSACALGTVMEDGFGLIWSGFWKVDRGVFCLNPETEEFRQYKLYPNMPENSNYNRIYSVYEDLSGIIWIGTWLRGLRKWDRMKSRFRSFTNDLKTTNSKVNTLVYNVVQDSTGFIWFITNDALNKYDVKTGLYKQYLVNEKNITKNGYSHILDKSGNIWIGTVKKGLIKFNPVNGYYRYYFNNPKDSVNLINAKIITMFQDHFGILWLGTEDDGLYKYDINKNELTHYLHDPYDPSSLGENRVNVIFEDSFSTLWIGTNLNGLDKFDRITEKFTYSCLKTILDVYEDKNKNFWIADYFTGLNLFDRTKNKIIFSYSKKDGLAHNAVQRILEDDNNNLWIGTDAGLSKFSIEKKTCRNYLKADGLPDNRFYWGGCKDKNGNMYFSTGAGLIYFHPDSIKDDPIPPKVVLNEVSLFNRPGEKLNFNNSISELKEITLPYDQNDLRFDFVGLHFSEPAANRYKYILENFDREWTKPSVERIATYTNLDPGDYNFRVRAANSDGVWNEAGTSIKIIILPPWWQTTWAYIIYILIISGTIYFIWKAQLKRIKIKNDFEMSRFESQKLHEVDKVKTRFFTNISHEFRTPLTLIQGPAKQIIEKTNEPDTRDGANFIYRNSQKLIRLVNQLLDLSKLEAGEMNIRASETDIITFLKEIVLSFTTFAERKNITLKFVYDEEQILVYLDRDKMYKIINNVLLNAFKFTPDGGSVDVVIPIPTKSVQNDDRGFVEIKISDTGIGIPKDRIEKIFDRFYQIDDTHTREQEGTGIGLALTKELTRFPFLPALLYGCHQSGRNDQIFFQSCL